jgi:geranylgeranyl diphosphate synthase type I
MPPHNSKFELEALLRRHLRSHPLWRRLAREAPRACAAVGASLTAPAKRVRPLLFLLAARGYGRDSVNGLLPAALALELAHAFVLIHDDLVDGSAVRRGGPALGARFDALLGRPGRCAVRGDDLALIAGDLLYTLAIEALLAVEATAVQRLRAQELLTEAALATGRGALLELLLARRPPAEAARVGVRAIYTLKTGWYTFRLPLMLAALYCGRLRRDGPAISRFSTPAGMAFQLVNDRAALRTWMNGGPVPEDVRDNRRTFAFVHAWRNGSAADRRSLERGDAAKVRAVFARERVLEAIEAEIRRCRGRALAGMEKLSFRRGGLAPVRELVKTALGG